MTDGRLTVRKKSKIYSRRSLTRRNLMEPLNRRGFLRMAGVASATWLTPVSQLLARTAETPASRAITPSRSSCSGCKAAPASETFDPHPGSASPAARRPLLPL